jgi:glycyl-tRNA synthetase
VAVFPIVDKPEFVKKAKTIYANLKKHFTAMYEEKGTIGRRYYDADEVGVPFAVTVDGRSLEDDTVTVRFRDTKEQIRIPVSELVPTLKRLMEQDKETLEAGA